MNTASRITTIVSGIGGFFAVYFTLLSTGVFTGFETDIFGANVTQTVFMCLVIIVAVAIAFETVVVLKQPKDLLQNLQSGLAKYTGTSEKEVGRFFGDVAGAAQTAAFEAVSKIPVGERFKNLASSLVQNVPTTVQVNQVATKGKRGKPGKRDVFAVTVNDTRYPTPAELIAKLRATFALLPLHPAQVNQVAAGTIITEQEDLEFIPPIPASVEDSNAMSEYAKQRNRRSLLFILACGIGCLVIWILSIYF